MRCSTIEKCSSIALVNDGCMNEIFDEPFLLLEKVV